MRRSLSLLPPLLLLGLAGSAWAYVTPEGDRTRWAQAPRPGIARCSVDVPVEACRAALVAAFATWARVEGAPLPMPAPVDGPADITVGFVADRPDLRGVAGVTITTTEGAGADRRVVQAEVLLNDDFDWSIAGPRGTLRVQATATHEIGHALGLGHSADRGASMYWHYDAAGAALGEDDRRGLRFLYGAPTGQGRSCDQCAVAADCAGGVCLQRFNEGDRPFCARACGGGCDVDEDCVGLVGGGDACVPAGGFCGDGGGLATGDPCWGPFQCTAPDRCVVFPGDARCSPPCDGPADCPGGQICALDAFDLPRACLPMGARRLGEPCDWATDCAGGVCLPEGVCARPCDDDCPAGWRCAPHARWPDAPRVCQPAPADMGVADAGLDAGPSPDAALAVTDAAAPDDASVDAGRPADARLEDARLTQDALIRRQPAGGGGCSAAPRAPRTLGWWWLLALGARRRWRSQ